MRKCQVCAYLLLILISKSYTMPDMIANSTNVKETCESDEYWNKNGFCCNRCTPGFKLVKKCQGKGMRSECMKCGEETYLDTLNYSENCNRCQQCKRPHSKEKSKCEYNKDRVCECEPGYYMKKLNSLYWQCLRCQECGQGQMEIKSCTQEENTVCKCMDRHYLVTDKNYCILCTECRQGCEHLCPITLSPVKSTSPTTPADTLPAILVPIFACVMVLAVAVFMVYEGVKHWRKRKRALSSQSSSPSPGQEHQTLIITVPPDRVNETLHTNHPCELEPHKLPDCVPREIKIHEFIYFVLDEVPVMRFKELVRRLGVSEQNIGWAEQDHRNCKDAQYQMLKVWSDTGSAGENNILPCHRIQMFVDTLKDMNLVSCADNIENKFLSPNTSQ